ncbi:MAG: PP2C family protein-serine/threonine phosphatase, partial [Planctomycetota bacterium]
GFALADATGHGLPGGVLATFVSRTLRGGVGQNGLKRSLSPDEVLSRINHDLLDAGFSDCPFVTALYAIYHEPTRTLTWTRGGAPYPILVHRGEIPRQIMSQGPLIGAVANAEFETVSLTLEPGDTVVFHTDGLEALVGDRRTQRGWSDLSNSEWFRRLGEQPLDRQIEDLEARLDSIDESDWRVDDVTVIALHVREQ